MAENARSFPVLVADILLYQSCEAMIATVLLGLLIFLDLTDSIVWGRQLSALEKNIIPGASLVERDSFKSLNVSDCPGERVRICCH